MRNRSKIGKALSAIVVVGLASAYPAMADVVNGGFESNGSPEPISWSVIGNTSTQDSNYYTPVQGVQQAVLSNGQASINGSANGSTTNISGAGGLNSFFGIVFGSPVKSGSGIKQTFTANAGDILKFSYDFVTTDPNNADQGFYTLQGPSGPTVLNNFANALQSGLTTVVIGDGLIYDDFNPGKQTLYQNVQFTLATTGTYTLGFGITNVNDQTGVSGLLLDAISVTPLPSAAWGGMAILGGLGLTQLARRRKTVLA